VLLTVVAIFDRASGVYSRPAFVNSTGMAIRSFQDEVNRDSGDNPMFNHAQDFDLCYLCKFDDNTGKFVTDGDGPVVLMTAVQAKN